MLGQSSIFIARLAASQVEVDALFIKGLPKTDGLHVADFVAGNKYTITPPTGMGVLLSRIEFWSSVYTRWNLVLTNGVVTETEQLMSSVAGFVNACKFRPALPIAAGIPAVFSPLDLVAHDRFTVRASFVFYNPGRTQATQSPPLP